MIGNIWFRRSFIFKLRNLSPTTIRTRTNTTTPTGTTTQAPITLIWNTQGTTSTSRGILVRTRPSLFQHLKVTASISEIQVRMCLILDLQKLSVARTLILFSLRLSHPWLWTSETTSRHRRTTILLSQTSQRRTPSRASALTLRRLSWMSSPNLSIQLLKWALSSHLRISLSHSTRFKKRRRNGRKRREERHTISRMHTIKVVIRKAITEKEGTRKDKTKN